MRGRKKLFPLLLALALVLGMLGGCGSAPAFSLTNDLGFDLGELYLSASDDGAWGDSLLGKGPLYSGDARELSLEAYGGAESFDIKAVDTEGDYYYFYSLPLSGGDAVSLIFLADGRLEARITPQKGDKVVVPGEFEFGEASETGMDLFDEDDDVIAAPSPEDPLVNFALVPGLTLDLEIRYPETLELVKESDYELQLSAVNEDEPKNCIVVSLVTLTGYDSYFTAGAEKARSTLATLAGSIVPDIFGSYYINSVGADFEDAGSYYSYIDYAWLSGAIFDEDASAPVRAAIEYRYYGPTGYLLMVSTIAEESVIRNYYDVAIGIMDAVDFGVNWGTGTAGSGSDPGDYGYDYWDDYDPWSDPGDYGYDYYDDEYYEPNDYDPWSDPGDYGYYEDDYDDEYYEPNDYDW